MDNPVLFSRRPGFSHTGSDLTKTVILHEPTTRHSKPKFKTIKLPLKAYTTDVLN